MNKILTHITQQHEYRSFIKAVFDNRKDTTEIFSANVHGNLFDIYNQTKVSTVILPTNEYTQEFHDFISEYHQLVKIILFINNVIDNDSILNYWNDTNVICCGRNELIKNSNLLKNKSYLYDRLYDSSIFMNTHQARNNKVAVLLSALNEKNDSILKDLLYPRTSLPLVLFNSTTYKKPQNVGFLSPSDACEIFNTYKSVIDIDHQFILETKACGIPSVDIGGDTIELETYKTYDYNIEQTSYDFFIKTSFLSLIE